MDFDKIIDRRGTHSAKWDRMDTAFGITAEDAIPMWVADMDFLPPDCVQAKVQEIHDRGMYTYFGGDEDYRAAIVWWMRNRHGWEIQPDWIFSTAGLVNAVSMCLDVWTAPGDHVALFTPVYHAFHIAIRDAGREVTQLQMPVDGSGMYALDFDAWESQLTGREKMLILCSPHNPAGRVWTRDELSAVAEFARKHDLLVISDEIHQDIVLPGHTHTPTALIDGIGDRLIVLNAVSKTFNIAGLHLGNVIIPDDTLRAAFAQRMKELHLGANSIGQHLVMAAYSPDGAAWVDALMTYLDGNRQVFLDGMAQIPGLSAMPMQATYLAWVDFAGTGMSMDEVLQRVQGQARIAPSPGTPFGTGGETFLRFNFGTRRALVEEAVERLQAAFSDLQ